MNDVSDAHEKLTRAMLCLRGLTVSPDTIVELRELAIGPIAERLGELEQSGLLAKANMAELVDTLHYAHLLTMETLVKLGASERDIRTVIRSNAYAIAISLNATNLERSHELYQEFKKSAPARARKGKELKRLDSEIRNQIVDEEWDKAAQELGEDTPRIRIAAVARPRANQRLEGSAQPHKLLASPYKTDESFLRARNQRLKDRNL
jgi:hypothetical protein